MAKIMVNPGEYEKLISQAIHEKLIDFSETDYLIKTENIDSAESYKMLDEYLTGEVSAILKSHFQYKDSPKTISAQVDVVNKILRFIETEWNAEGIETTPDLLSEENKYT